MRIAAAWGVATLALAGTPVLADSVAVGTSNGKSTVVTSDGKPCRVVNGEGNSTTVTAGRNGASSTTTVAPGGGSSVTVGSGSSTGPNSAGSDCVVTRPNK